MHHSCTRLCKSGKTGWGRAGLSHRSPAAGPGFGLGVRVAQAASQSILSTVLCQGSSPCPGHHENPQILNSTAPGSVAAPHSTTRLAAGKSPVKGAKHGVASLRGVVPVAEPAEGEAGAVCWAAPPALHNCSAPVPHSSALVRCPAVPALGTTFPLLRGVADTSSRCILSILVDPACPHAGSS